MTAASPAAALKRSLAERHRLLVVNIDYTNASLVEFLARNAADVIFIDCEQGDTSIESIADLVRAGHLADTPVLVRVPDAGPATIERYLFRGVDGIVLPRLDTPDQMGGVVDAVRYCFGGGATDKTIVVQVETVAAASRIEAILGIDGIDALFIGPVDLSRSMGHGGAYRVAAVAAEVERLVQRIRRSGRSVGMLVDAQTASSFADKGVNFLYLHTNDLLRHGTAPFLEAKAAPANG